ncbi:MAG TPA: histidine phosphatase family protein [Solirubrobacteraceae bacterium]|nr:histidine phosphatase family protein [Solirubrobacteraceae bacterium]
MTQGLGLEGIVLARHGETDDNVEPLRFQGFTDTPLNATGRAQARALATRIAQEGTIRAIWASDLSRARETAETVGAAIGLAVSLDARLREGDRGRWEGHTFAEIEAAEPERYASWRRPDPDFRFPEGESLAEQQARVTAALRDIHGAAPAPTLVVCHGGSIRVMLCAADPDGLAAFHRFTIPNTAVVTL